MLVFYATSFYFMGVKNNFSAARRGDEDDKVLAYQHYIN